MKRANAVQRRSRPCLPLASLARSQAMAMSPDLVAPQIGAVGSQECQHKTPVDSLDREHGEDLSIIAIRCRNFYLQAIRQSSKISSALFKRRHLIGRVVVEARRL